MADNGIDPESAYTIQAKVEGYCNKQSDGKKVYVKGKTLVWIVDSDRFSLCELKSDLSEKLEWGSSQTPKTWIVHKNEGTKSLLESDSQILEMFKTYEKEKRILIRVVICDLEVSSKGSATKATYPCTPAQVMLPVEIGSQVGSIDEELPRINDRNAYGYVGLHDEYLYFSDAEDDDQSDKNCDVEEVNFESDPISLNDVQSDEPTVEGVGQSEKILSHDPENSKIEVDALFPDVRAFRKALRQFAIKHEFVVQIIKTDKKRYIGKCQDSSCPWRIQASIVRERKRGNTKRNGTQDDASIPC